MLTNGIKLQIICAEIQSLTVKVNPWAVSNDALDQITIRICPSLLNISQSASQASPLS